MRGLRGGNNFRKAVETELGGWSGRLTSGEPAESLTFSGLLRGCAEREVHGDDMRADMRGGAAVGVGRFWKSSSLRDGDAPGDGDAGDAPGDGDAGDAGDTPGDGDAGDGDVEGDA